MSMQGFFKRSSFRYLIKLFVCDGVVPVYSKGVIIDTKKTKQNHLCVDNSLDITELVGRNTWHPYESLDQTRLLKACRIHFYMTQSVLEAVR